MMEGGDPEDRILRRGTYCYNPNQGHVFSHTLERNYYRSSLTGLPGLTDMPSGGIAGMAGMCYDSNRGHVLSRAPERNYYRSGLTGLPGLTDVPSGGMAGMAGMARMAGPPEPQRHRVFNQR